MSERSSDTINQALKAPANLTNEGFVQRMVVPQPKMAELQICVLMLKLQYSLLLYYVSLLVVVKGREIVSFYV